MKQIQTDDVLAFLWGHPQRTGYLQAVEVLDVKHDMGGRYVVFHLGVSGGHLYACFSEDGESTQTDKVFYITSLETCFDFVDFDHQKGETTMALLFTRAFLKDWYAADGICAVVR